MKFLLRIGLPVLIIVSIVTVPRVASAQLALPFGGTIAFIIPCANAVIYTIVISARNIDPLVPGPYIWTPITMTSITPPIPSIPPVLPGQQILGTWDIPWFCYIPPFTFLFGWRMQTEGVSTILGV